MDRKKLEGILEDLKSGRSTVKQAMESLKSLPFEDLGFAKLDTHRSLRRGAPEVVYCPGKSDEALVDIFSHMSRDGGFAFGTKATDDNYRLLRKRLKGKKVEYHPSSRIILVGRRQRRRSGSILVISAGTSDIPIAEEAAVTAEILGGKVTRLYDVGVAGLHRLTENKHLIDKANVIIVIAGMEGALPSVVSGMTDKPVIAVPTSIGYGASFDGLAALLAMLNSCSPGVVVVNIDNGFGAGYFAAMVNQKNAKTCQTDSSP